MEKITHAVCLVVAASFSTLSHADGCSAWAGTSDGYTDTQHPFLMVHGITGFDTVGGLLGYFHTVPMNLCRSGADVVIASVSPFNDSEQRGLFLADDINSGVYGDAVKYNVFAHSQGSPTTRAAITFDAHANAEGQGHIASLTSVDGVNNGSRVADMIRGVIPADSSIEGGVAAVANAFGSLIAWISGDEHSQDSIAALDSLTSVGTADLNSRHPYGTASGECVEDRDTVVTYRGNEIHLYSWAGKSVMTNILDLLDPFLFTTSLAFGGEANDGMVSVCSQKLGEYLGDYDANHIDVINHVMGVGSIWHNPVSLYRVQANRLKNIGL
ncbi:triacylglycerol lipase [Hahella aquimaris]|uniref:esterase/lipase family protein n=1 Tax=Hahella sp. HNIBRBA332 TaxID=3015983 RepID=UPI00273C2B67|nr:triacylglycerol lipase [Hahella sp. HNIBRBA332]WLQ17125.1 triacylglycerol lipase [Hahella sp. HNIBRBA332]